LRHGIHLPIVKLTVYVMAYTHLLYCWHSVMIYTDLLVQRELEVLCSKNIIRNFIPSAQGQRSRSIEHFGLSQYRGKHCLVYCLHWQFQSWYILTYYNVESFSHGIYSSIVSLTISVMVYTHLLHRWQFRSWCILTYCSIDSFSHGIYLPIVTLTASVMAYTHLL
jgi:hypothetical protein